MIATPDFRNSAASKAWREAFDAWPRPANFTADQWAQVIDLSQHAAVSAMETFYRIAVSSHNIPIAANTIMNGGELAKFMIDNLQSVVSSLHEKDGGKTESFGFVMGPNGLERATQ